MALSDGREDGSSKKLLDRFSFDGEKFSSLPVSNQARRKREPRNVLSSTLFAGIGWLFAAGMLLYIMSQGDSNGCNLTFPTPLYSPAQHLIEYQLVEFNSGFDAASKKYTLPPSPETDHVWNSLFQKYFEPTPELAHHGFPIMNGTTPDSDGNRTEWWSVYVFHQLHCINQLRMGLWPEYYDAEKDLMLSRFHLTHCLETLRKSVMCYSDITPFAFRWIDDVPFPHMEWDHSPHVCRNFEKIHAWAKDIPNVIVPGTGELA